MSHVPAKEKQKLAGTRAGKDVSWHSHLRPRRRPQSVVSNERRTVARRATKTKTKSVPGPP